MKLDRFCKFFKIHYFIVFSSWIFLIFFSLFFFEISIPKIPDLIENAKQSNS